MINFLHTYLPQSIMLQIDPIAIHWYGFLIAMGALIGFLCFYWLGRKYGLTKDKIYDLAFYLVIFGLIGDRLYYVIYAWPYYSHNLLDIFKIWQGGLAIHGAMIAGLLVIWFFAKKNKISPWLLLDLAVVALAIAMAVGRWGNYFNQELYGWPANLPWAIPISPEKRPAEFFNDQYFHPAFLYESLFNLSLALIMIVWHVLRLKKNKTPDQRGFGNIALFYFMFYSLGRFLNEYIRIDYSPYVMGIRWAQIISFVIFIGAGAILIYKTIKNKQINQNQN